MQQALAFGVGSALTFYFGFESLNKETVQPGFMPVGVYNYPTGSLTNSVFNPTKGPNFTFAQDYTEAMQEKQQDLINESRLNQTHQILNPFRSLGDNQMGEPPDTPWPQVNVWTSSKPDSTRLQLSYQFE